MRLRRERDRRSRALRPLKSISWVDLGTWLAAFACAVGLWLLVNIGERTSERTLRVHLEPENVPAGLVITNPIPEYAEVRVSGSGLILSSIDEKDLRSVLDLSGARPGTLTYTLDPKRFELPRKVEVSRVTPSQITFQLDRMAKRSIPVRLERTGEVRAGLRLTELALLPEKVEVSGPQSRLDALPAILTAPFDLGTLRAGTRQVELDLMQPGGLVRLDAPAIRVRSVVEPIVIERELRRVKLQVRDADNSWRVSPESVTVVVRGPEIEVKALELEPGAAYVATEGLEGEAPHRVKPRVTLPEGIELVRVEPAEVALAPAGESRANGAGSKRTEKKT
ncbi:MAG: CdaR family protein [Thermodesulfobacteriota bacterium]